MSKSEKKNYNLKEEKFNVFSHFLGLVLSLFGTIYLVSLSESTTHLVSYLIYGGSGFVLYLMSSLYHAAKNEKVRNILKVCDHAAIYIFIAGCYTPFLLLNFANQGAYVLLGTIWALTLLGVVFKIFFTGRFEKTSTLIYLAMGWMVVTQGQSLILLLNLDTLFWLLVGGLCYSFGSIFYLWNRLPFNHGIWHVFVVLGSVSHYVALLASSTPTFSF